VNSSEADIQLFDRLSNYRKNLLKTSAYQRSRLSQHSN